MQYFAMVMVGELVPIDSPAFEVCKLAISNTSLRQMKHRMATTFSDFFTFANNNTTPYLQYLGCGTCLWPLIGEFINKLIRIQNNLIFKGAASEELKNVRIDPTTFLGMFDKVLPKWREIVEIFDRIWEVLPTRKYGQAIPRQDGRLGYETLPGLQKLRSIGHQSCEFYGLKKEYMPMSIAQIMVPPLRYVPFVFLHTLILDFLFFNEILDLYQQLGLCHAPITC